WTPEVRRRPPRSLNALWWLRRSLVRAKLFYYTRFWGMEIDPTARFSLSVRFDQTYPKGIHVGAYSYIAFETAILAHDMIRGLYLHTRVGQNCFIGARSVVLPGVQIGDGSVVAAGSIVTKDVPPGCLVGGNPARTIREGIQVGPYGRFMSADETKARLV